MFGVCISDTSSCFGSTQGQMEGTTVRQAVQLTSLRWRTLQSREKRTQTWMLSLFQSPSEYKCNCFLSKPT